MATPMTKLSDPTAINYKRAQVVAFNSYVDEDVTLLIEGTFINCFITYCPYEIEIGKTYNVELTLNLSDDYAVERVAPTGVLAEKAGRGYSYYLYGDLYNDTFSTFTSLSAEGVNYEHPECNEHFIKLSVERVDVSFH